MRNAALLMLLLAFSCKKQPVYAPEGSAVGETKENPAERARNLNLAERAQIQKWIGAQSKKFYPMPLNYWTDAAPEDRTARKPDGTFVAYEYDIYDFAGTKIYREPVRKAGHLGKIQDLKAAEDAVRYLKPGTGAEILVPSVLAFGTYGDSGKISNDVPLILKTRLKRGDF